MNTKIVREDYKRIFIVLDILAVIMIITNAFLNILNLGKILYLYIALECISVTAILFFIGPFIYERRNLSSIDIEDNYLFFYVSDYYKNKIYKIINIIIDFITLLF